MDLQELQEAQAPLALQDHKETLGSRAHLVLAEILEAQDPRVLRVQAVHLDWLVEQDRMVPQVREVLLV